MKCRRKVEMVHLAIIWSLRDLVMHCSVLMCVCVGGGGEVVGGGRVEVLEPLCGVMLQFLALIAR